MRKPFTGAMVAATVAAAAAVVSLTVMPLSGQAPAAGAGQGRAGAAGQGRAQGAAPAARPAPTVSQPARIAGHPNINGIYQAMTNAYWNVEDHPAQATEFWQLGAIGAIPPGMSIVEGGTIPYKPAALKQRDENRKGWPKNDPEAKCYMPGIPRANYMPYPFQIVQGDKDILFVYEYASANRLVHMLKHTEAAVDSWMGWANGSWQGDTLVVENTGFNDGTWFDRAGNFHSDQLKVTERFTPAGQNLNYEATIEDPETFTRSWKIDLPLYKHLEKNFQLLEYKCVEFSEELLYGDLKKKTE
ncbi:MAG TPA: hypothetical protein VL173_14070 [Vicinamibacterales bacterium]|nr:hypothetical protein [Vicinamibacterales bacterium]